MKRILLILLPALLTTFLITSCSKDDPTPAVSATPQGTWVGTGQYGTGGGNPTYAFTLNFKANGTVDIVGNNNSAIDNATGTWQLIQDSVKATYTYAASSAIYSLSGKFSATSNIMVGTIGLTSSTTGIGIFSVTRQ